jgi:hypothetical protein
VQVAFSRDCGYLAGRGDLVLETQSHKYLQFCSSNMLVTNFLTVPKFTVNNVAISEKQIFNTGSVILFMH